MTVVEATATFAPNTDLGRRLEAAMSAAALQAYSEGVTDPDVVRQRIQDAIDAVKASQ